LIISVRTPKILKWFSSLINYSYDNQLSCYEIHQEYFKTILTYFELLFVDFENTFV